LGNGQIRTRLTSELELQTEEWGERLKPAVLKNETDVSLSSREFN